MQRVHSIICRNQHAEAGEALAAVVPFVRHYVEAIIGANAEAALRGAVPRVLEADKVSDYRVWKLPPSGRAAPVRVLPQQLGHV